MLTPAIPAPRGRWLALVAALASVNLLYGVVSVLMRPDRALDLLILRDWWQEWLSGRDVYAHAGWTVDYPPWGLAFLSPLAFVPQHTLVILWTGVELLLALLLPCLVVKALFPAARPRDFVWPLLLCLLWDGAWTTLQFTRVAMGLGLLAMLWSDRHPWTAGLLLGLALVKPQIGAPFLLWALLMRRGRSVATGAVVVALGWLLYSVRAHGSPIAVLTGYAGMLRALYTGQDVAPGLTSLRGFILPLAAVPTTDALMLAFGAAVCAALLLSGVWERRRAGRVSYAAPALACLVPLLFFFNFTNNLVVLILPAVVVLLYSDDPETAGIRAAGLAVLQTLLMLQPALHAHRIIGPGALLTAIEQIDRVVVIALFLSTAVLLARRLRGMPANVT